MNSGQVMTTFMPPPPAATYLAFHPQDNNVIAVGMEDSTIQIYNVRVDEVLFLLCVVVLGCTCHFGRNSIALFLSPFILILKLHYVASIFSSFSYFLQCLF